MWPGTPGLHPHPDPGRSCGDGGKAAPPPRESWSCSWGRDAGKGCQRMEETCSRVEEWPGRFLHFSSPPSLTHLLLPPRNLRSDGQKVAFAGRTVKWASSGRGVVRGFPSLNWAQNQALCPRFKPVVRSVRRWAAAEARELKQLGQLRSFQRERAARRGPA